MVDKKAVLTNLKNFYEWNFKNYPLNFDEAQVIIEALETETPHAKWIEHPNERGRNWEDSMYECSNCNEWADYDSDYCPNCGAKMDGVDKQ